MIFQCLHRNVSSVYTAGAVWCNRGERYGGGAFGGCHDCSCGQYQSKSVHRDTTCSTCGVGQYSGSGASSCSTCGPGMFSGSGSCGCTKCPPGTYNPSSGSSECIHCLPGINFNLWSNRATIMSTKLENFLAKNSNFSETTPRGISWIEWHTNIMFGLQHSRIFIKISSVGISTLMIVKLDFRRPNWSSHSTTKVYQF